MESAVVDMLDASWASLDAVTARDAAKKATCPASVDASRTRRAVLDAPSALENAWAAVSYAFLPNEIAASDRLDAVMAISAAYEEALLAVVESERRNSLDDDDACANRRASSAVSCVDWS